MLDSKEVRAGNWVLKITGTDSNLKPFFQFKAVAADEFYFTFAKVCFPITITPSILGQCSFKHEFGDWYMNIAEEGVEDSLPFLRYKDSDKCWYLRNTKLWAQPVYLHQLQNLYFALLHKELQICLDDFENTVMVGPINFFVKSPRKFLPVEVLL
jgi:hypothetical protein